MIRYSLISESDIVPKDFSNCWFNNCRNTSFSKGVEIAI